MLLSMYSFLDKRGLFRDYNPILAANIKKIFETTKK
jgi:hypothetical protein